MEMISAGSSEMITRPTRHWPIEKRRTTELSPTKRGLPFFWIGTRSTAPCASFVCPMPAHAKVGHLTTSPQKKDPRRGHRCNAWPLSARACGGRLLDAVAYIPTARAFELFNRDGLMKIDVAYAEDIAAALKARRVTSGVAYRRDVSASSA
ncbi:MAG: hypothetical protein QFF03_03090 [Pseudomonadota bacterium]|nr:hypothetical protein [Pseudomonadota bacterium]